MATLNCLYGRSHPYSNVLSTSFGATTRPWTNSTGFHLCRTPTTTLMKSDQSLVIVAPLCPSCYYLTIAGQWVALATYAIRNASALLAGFETHCLPGRNNLPSDPTYLLGMLLLPIGNSASPHPRSLETGLKLLIVLLCRCQTSNNSKCSLMCCFQIHYLDFKSKTSSLLCFDSSGQTLECWLSC